MKHLAIIAWTDENRIAKFQDYTTAAKAAAHVRRVRDQYPDAFATTSPNGILQDWRVDPATKTLTLDPLPPGSPPPPTDTKVLCRALQDKGIGTITDADMAAARKAIETLA